MRRTGMISDVARGTCEEMMNSIRTYLGDKGHAKMRMFSKKRCPQVAERLGIDEDCPNVDATAPPCLGTR